MAWCRQATSHYLNQCWHSSMSPYGITRCQWVSLVLCITDGLVTWFHFAHYSVVIMGMMASQIISVSKVYLTVYSGADQRKHQSSASLAFVWEIHWWPVNSPHKWSVTLKMFPFDDVIMPFSESASHKSCSCFVLLCFVVNQWVILTHICQGYFTRPGRIMWINSLAPRRCMSISQYVIFKCFVVSYVWDTFCEIALNNRL